MTMVKLDKADLKILLTESMIGVLIAADMKGINHPYWTDKTANLMADAALLIVLAADLPKDEE